MVFTILPQNSPVRLIAGYASILRTVKAIQGQSLLGRRTVLTKDKIVEAIGNGWLDGECLSGDAVQNHRVLFSIGTEDPSLAVPGRATQKTAAALRQILFGTIAVEVDRLDRRPCREIAQLLFCVDVHLGPEGAEL